MTAGFRLPSFALTLALALALLATGFGHRMPPAQERALSIYLLAGGTMQDLCDRSGDSAVMGTGCEVCRLTAAAVVPPPVQTAAPRVTLLALDGAPLVRRAPHHAPRDPGHGTRAPPLA